jgi:hypothetical protein
MKQIHLIIIVLTFAIPITIHSRYHGPRQQRTDAAQIITVQNNTPYTLYVYFKPYVQLNRCDLLKGKICRFGYAVAASATKTITLTKHMLGTRDLDEGILDNTGMVYGAVIARTTINGAQPKAYITIHDGSAYTVNMYGDQLKIIEIRSS